MLLSGAPDYSAPVAQAQAINFDGVDDYVDVDDGGIFQFADTTFTLSLWINTTSAINQCAVSKGGGGSSGWYVQTNTSGLIVPIIKTTGGVNCFVGVSVASVNDGQWRHCAFVFTTDTATAGNNTASIFVDGASSDGTPATTGGGTYVAPTDHTKIGTRTGSLPFAGSIQDVRIYNRALSAAEAEILYKSRIGPGNPIASGLVGYYPLDDLTPGTGDLASATIVDRSGNANHGTGSDANASANQGVAGFLTGP